MRSLWVKPLTTSLAFNLLMLSSALCLTLYTHLQAMGFLPFGNGTIFQVSVDSKAYNSLFMAAYQSGWEDACSKV